MLELLHTLSMPQVWVPAAALIFVLFADFGFRWIIYDRSDPFSFSILSFSFLLVAVDISIAIIRAAQNDNYRFLIPVFIYLILFVIVLIFAIQAHRALQASQEREVVNYLQQLRVRKAGLGEELENGELQDALSKIENAAPHAENAVWRLLGEIGKGEVEPDAFERNPKKRRKRIAYLRNVRTLTGCTMDPNTEQTRLLVRDSATVWAARVMYGVTVSFGLISTLYFLVQRSQ